jgi:hypothetical protein
MSLGLWPLSAIQSKIRRLTGRPSANQLSDADLLNYINRYYLLKFPLEIRPMELETWFEATLTAGQDTYLLDDLSFDGYLSIGNPMTINSYPLECYYDPDEFYDDFPDLTTYDNGRPSAVLFYNASLTFRAPPDASNTAFKAAAQRRPTAFTGIVTEYPEREEWADVICYGTAQDILTDNGEMTMMSYINPLYAEAKAILMRKPHEQLITQRAKPRF